jgi:hypothetical protein
MLGWKSEWAQEPGEVSSERAAIDFLAYRLLESRDTGTQYFLPSPGQAHNVDAKIVVAARSHWQTGSQSKEGKK